MLKGTPQLRKHPLFVFEIRVLILNRERTRQFMKLFSITFYKIRKSILRFLRFLPPNFYQTSRFV
jgi:hypothetical protein